MKNSVVIALVVGAVVVAGAAVAAIRFFVASPSLDAAVELVPEDAWLYANLFVDPSADQKRALDDLLRHFPEIESTNDAINELGELLNEPLSELGLTFERDIEPWLGAQVSFFLTGEGAEPDGAFLIGTTDVDATRAAVNSALDRSGDVGERESRSHAGTDYEAIERGEGPALGLGAVDDFFVIGSEPAFKEVVDAAAGDDALGGTSAYSETMEALADDPILSVYMDQGTFFDVLESGGEFGPQERVAFDALFGDAELGAAGIAVAARSDGLLMESTSKLPEGELSDFAGLLSGSELLAEMPADAWLTFAVSDVGETVDAFFDTFEDLPGFSRDSADAALRQQTGLELDDVLSWMGDVGVFVQGTNFQEMGGGLVIESSDPDATRAALDRVRDVFEGFGAPTNDVERNGFSGFSITRGLPAPIYALLNDRLVITYGDRATNDAIRPEEPLRDDPTFRRAQEALGAGMQPGFFVDVAEAIALVDFAMSFGGMPTDQTYEQEVKPWLEPLSFLAGGSRIDEDRVVQAYFLGVE